MALPSFAAETVTRLRPTETIIRGSTVLDWSKPDELNIVGCLMQPGSTTLSMDGRELGISDGYTAYFPPGADVQAGDRIMYAGATYTIMGDIRPWKSPTGLVSNLQAQLERWSG